MSVASCDQPAGTSAPSILKTTEPSGFVMTLERRSQVTSSRGLAPRWVKRRSKASPRPRAAFFFSFFAAALEAEDRLVPSPWVSSADRAARAPPLLLGATFPPSPTIVGCAIGSTSPAGNGQK